MIGPKVAKWLTPAQERDGRELVKLRDGGVCARCRRIDPFWGVNHDHRLNRSQGGDWSPSNGELLCGSGTTGCHGWRTSHPRDAVADGWAVPGGADWREWPARRWVRDGSWPRLAWVIYDDAGGFTEISEAEAHERMGREAA